MRLERHVIDTPYLVGPVEIYEFWIQGVHFLVDTGPQTEVAERYLEERIDLASLDYLLITHCHPDHYGLSNYISHHSPAEILFARVDACLYERFDERIAYLAEELSTFGFPKEMYDHFHGLLPKFQGDIPFPKQYQILEEREGLLKGLGVEFLACPGHSQSDLVFLVEDYALTGDILLKNIFTAPLLDMDLTKGEGRFSNYRAYVESIGKLKTLEGRRILPSHNQEVESVKAQVDFYVAKMIKRANRLKPLAEQGMSKFELLGALLPEEGQKSAFYYYIKAGELYFFLDFLKDPMILSQALEDAGYLTDELAKKIEGLLD